jgi:triacylglycerol esterase/lipase EstA (alpha/beta hydrolase family)
MHGIVMLPLSQSLNKLGYDTEIISYNSVTIEEENVFQSIDTLLEHAQTNILVGHSLGGLIIKHYLASRKPPISLISHVVTIGSPLQGASIVEKIKEMGLGQIFGNSTEYGLTQHQDEWHFPQKLGSIAGTISVGFRPILMGTEHLSDGTVTIEETKIKGMTDHLETSHTHSSLIFSTEVAGQIDTFIRHGRFHR